MLMYLKLNTKSKFLKLLCVFLCKRKGTKGSVHVNNLNKGDITVRNSLGEKSKIMERGSSSHIPLIQNFTQAILKNHEPSVTGEIGREVNKILGKIYNNV